jgi:hypothetical protein
LIEFLLMRFFAHGEASRQGVLHHDKLILASITGEDRIEEGLKHAS